MLPCFAEEETFVPPVTAKRLEWVDIFKGMVMILVVIGHATSQFNIYIYQFHMAAFFFISGFLDTSEKKTWGKLIKDKFFTLYFPLLFFVFLSSILEAVLEIGGYRSFLYGTSFGGIFFNLQEFVLRGDIYPQSLGACWFLLTLCGTFLLQKLILTICADKKDKLYLCFAVVLVLLGSFLTANQTYMQVGPFSMDLIFRANFYFSFGAVTHQFLLQKRPEGKKKTAIKVLLFAVSCAILVYLAPYKVISNWPARKFPFIAVELLAAINGIFLIWNIAMALEKAPPAICRIFTVIGKNTMGILIFHFYIFKICMAGLYAAGLMSAEEVQAVVPKGEVSNRYWLMFTVLAIVGSLAIWQVCKKIPVVDFCIGTRRDLYNQIRLPHRMTTSFPQGRRNEERTRVQTWMRSCKQWSLRHRTICCGILLACAICVCTGIYYGKSGARNLQEFARAIYYCETLECTEGLYQDGWCAPELKIHCGSRAAKQLQITGYYPGTLDGKQKIEVYVNGVLRQTVDVASEQIQINLNLDKGLNQLVEIKSDFQMATSENDIRDLAFVLVDMKLA